MSGECVVSVPSAAWGRSDAASAFRFGAGVDTGRLLFSGSAGDKLFIGNTLHKGRYDYREEWQRFTHALADDANGLSAAPSRRWRRWLKVPPACSGCGMMMAIILPSRAEPAAASSGGTCGWRDMPAALEPALGHRAGGCWRPAWANGVWLIVP
jgi:hypothetical protein